MLRVLRLGMLGAAVLAAPPPASRPADAAQTQFTNTGGTVSIDATNDLVVAGSSLGSLAGLVSLACPLTSIPPTSRYALEWSCSGGNFTLQSTDGSTRVSGTFRAGTFTLKKVGGGIGGHITYWYAFMGVFAGTLTTSGQSQPITGATTQALAALRGPLGPGTIQSGTTSINTVYAATYVADTYNDRIVRVDDMTGTNWIAFGGAGPGIGQFVRPWGIAVDQAGKIYVADNGNDRVVRVDDMTGTNWSEFGTAGSGQGQFSRPSGVFLDAAGKIYVADAGNSRIVRMDDMSGTGWTTFGTAGSGTHQFNNPTGVFVESPAGMIYVADTMNDRIVCMDDMAGTNWTTFGSRGGGLGQFSYPAGVAVDPAGIIYVADSVNDRIVRMDDMAGTSFTTLGSLGAGGGQFINPYAVVVDPTGTIYVADTRNSRIVRFDDMLGANWTTFGGYGTTAGTFDNPKGILVVTPTTSTTSTSTTTSTTTTRPPAATTSSTSTPRPSTTSTTTSATIPPTTTPLLPPTTTTLPCTSARCAIDRALRSPDCAGDTIPPSITKKLDKAVPLIELASSAPPKKAKLLLRHANSTLKLGAKAAGKAAKGKKPKLSSGCAAAIREAADGVRGGLLIKARRGMGQNQ